MRKHARPIAIAAGLLVGGATVGIAADAAAAKRGKSAKRDPTVHVIEHAITDTEIPSGGGKDVKGNVLTFNNPVFNVANTKRVGHDEGSILCKSLVLRHAREVCSGSFRTGQPVLLAIRCPA